MCRKAVIYAGKQLNDRYNQWPLNNADALGDAALKARWCGEQVHEVIESALSPLSKFGNDHYTSYELTTGQLVITHLDGSEGFLYGQPNYSIGAAYTIDNQTVFAGVFNPYYKEFFFAEMGKSPKRNNVNISVNKVASISNAYLGLSYRGIFEDASPVALTSLTKVLQLPLRTMMPGSDLYGLSMLANGNLAAMILTGADYNTLIPGLELVKQSGGHISDFDGAPPTSDSRTILASNGAVHSAFLEALAKNVLI